MKIIINNKILEFDILFVACDPKSINIDYTNDELEILNNLKSYKFKTTNIKIKNPKNNYVAVYDFDEQNKKKGNIYEIRDEFRKNGNPKAFNNEFSYLTCYQWLPNNDDIDFDEILINDINEKKWLTNIIRSFKTEYFQHFDSNGLMNNLPLKILQNQGMHNTFFVSSFTYFESVNNCYEYIDWLLIKKDLLKKYSKDTKICVIGAGPSGLMTSYLFLQKLNFTDITIIEKNNTYGGKTQTFYEQEDFGKITIELGTCYLSQSYKNLIKDLNITGLFEIGGAESSRGVKINNTIIDFNDWVLSFVSGLSKPLKVINILDSLFKYLRLYELIFYDNSPIQIISDLYKDDLYNKNFKTFMKENYLDSLEGFFIYSYQVQGYGILSEIPTYYVLIWLKPVVIWSIINNVIQQIINQILDIDPIKGIIYKMIKKLKIDNVVVLGIKDGWGSVWDNLVNRTDKIKFINNVENMKIIRF